MNHLNDLEIIKATEMILNIKNEFKEKLKTIDWLDEQSRRTAIDKVHNI